MLDNHMYEVLISSFSHISGKDAKIEPQASPVTAAEINESPSKLLGTTKAADATGKLGSVISPGMSTALELRNPSSINAMTSPTSVPPCSVLPSEVWLQVYIWKCLSNYSNTLAYVS